MSGKKEKENVKSELNTTSSQSGTRLGMPCALYPPLHGRLCQEPIESPTAIDIPHELSTNHEVHAEPKYARSSRQCSHIFSKSSSKADPAILVLHRADEADSREPPSISPKSTNEARAGQSRSAHGATRKSSFPESNAWNLVGTDTSDPVAMAPALNPNR